jgi:hypothetical protein
MQAAARDCGGADPAPWLHGLRRREPQVVHRRGGVGDIEELAGALGQAWQDASWY